MKISNINSCLNNTETDKKVGVKLVHLTGNEKMSVFAIELAMGQSIPAHYHKNDIETYFILYGQGIIHTGILENENVLWHTEMQVNAGDCFTIHPGEVHEFKNVSESPLRILGTAPLSHSKNDRHFIAID
ncbi:MAG: cupin domain-containing protein [Bacteroidetes bacterium]|nr:cupin domain-containing protein [Bacteroidota bacterium]